MIKYLNSDFGAGASFFAEVNLSRNVACWVSALSLLVVGKRNVGHLSGDLDSNLKGNNSNETWAFLSLQLSQSKTTLKLVVEYTDLLVFSVFGWAHSEEEKEPALFRNRATGIGSSSNKLSLVFSIELEGNINHLSVAVCVDK